jgi:hypothetical protein
VSAVLMVTTYLFGRTAGIATAAAIGSVFALLWYGFALRAWVTER